MRVLSVWGSRVFLYQLCFLCVAYKKARTGGRGVVSIRPSEYLDLALESWKDYFDNSATENFAVAKCSS